MLAIIGRSDKKTKEKKTTGRFRAGRDPAKEKMKRVGVRKKKRTIPRKRRSMRPLSFSWKWGRRSSERTDKRKVVVDDPKSAKGVLTTHKKKTESRKT